MSVKFLVASILFVCAARADDVSSFRRDYTYYPEAQVWLKVQLVPLEWSNALEKCKQEGAVLASPINEDLYAIMKNIVFQQKTTAFIGVSSVSKMHDFSSVDGVPLIDMPINWAPGEPNNVGDAERCLAIVNDAYAKKGALADVSCDTPRRYMCYKKNDTLLLNSIRDKSKQDISSLYVFDSKSFSWLKYHAEPKSFYDAVLQCKSEGATVASPHTDEMEDAMLALARSYPILTGFHNIISNNTFYSLEGKPLIQNVLSQDQITSIGSIALTMMENGDLHYSEANDSYPYICKKIVAFNAFTCDTTANGYIANHETGSCYKFHAVGQVWVNASNICAAEGAHLAIINNNVEAKALGDLIETNKKDIKAFDDNVITLGFYRMTKSSQWYTIQGETLQNAGYTQFHSDEPRDDHCGAMYPGGQLDDVPCNTAHAFICESYLLRLSNNHIKEKNKLK